MTIPVDHLQKLEGITIIEMFQIDLVSGLHYQAGDTAATTLYRFHNGTNGLNQDLIWQGLTYNAIACKAEGFETGENSVMARPTLTFANTGGGFSTILALVNSVTPSNDLQKARVTRKRTLAQFLDSQNFPSNTNPYGTPDDTKKLDDEIFDINKKTLENNQICSFELVKTIDFETLFLPRKQITKDRFPACGTFVFV